MANILISIPLPGNVKSVDDVEFKIIDINDNEIKNYYFNDEKTPNRIRLTIVFSNILARIISVVGDNFNKISPLGFKY